MSRRLPGWAARALAPRRDSDLDLPPSCTFLVRPLEIWELVPYQQGPRAFAVMLGPDRGFAWHREIGDALGAQIAGEVGCAT